MIDLLTIDLSCCIKPFLKGIKRGIVLIEVFRINVKRKGINNNFNRYHQKPMYRKRALLKALKNRR